MKKTAAKVKRAKQEVLIYVAVATLTLLSLINLTSYFSPKKVLGLETHVNFVTSDNSDKFWGDFLSKHPDYVPGLIEQGQIEKATKVDPNYITP